MSLKRGPSIGLLLILWLVVSSCSCLRGSSFCHVSNSMVVHAFVTDYRLKHVYEVKYSGAKQVISRSNLDKRTTLYSIQTTSIPDAVITLSEDPKVFLVQNFLSPEECQMFINRAETNEDKGGLQRSNAPQVTLNKSRLWPLPFLCLGAGIPSILRLFQESSSDDAVEFSQILSTALPPIAISSAITIFFVVTLTKGMQFYAQSSSRTSESLSLNSPQDVDFIRPLVDRACAETNHSWKNWEAPVITKYSPGAVFASHNDASATRGSEWSDLGGQRVVTVITYLNTCQKGGGTRFGKLGFTVQPKQGSALIFFPADGDTWEADERTVHQSLEAIEEKFIIQMFGRGQRVPPPLGIPDSFQDSSGGY